MFKINCYKYDSAQEANGYRGEDFSVYVLQGQDVNEDITQILDTGELTLAGLPTQKAFDPETKFIIDIVEFSEILPETIVKTLNWVVSRDIPNQPILSDDNYFDHHISFIEPSVVVQKRLVDNIASTYKLKSVNITEIPAFEQKQSVLNIESSEFNLNDLLPNAKFGYFVTRPSSVQTQFKWIYGKYFQLEGDLQLLNYDGEVFENIYNNIDSFKHGNTYMARFKIPKLAIMFGIDNETTFSKIGYASIDYKIEEFELNNPLNPTRSWQGTFISNSDLGEKEVNGFASIIDGEWLIEKTEGKKAFGTTVEERYTYYKKYTDKTAEDTTYFTPFIEIAVDKKYVVTISIHQFNTNFPSNQLKRDKYIGAQPRYLITHATQTIVVGTDIIITQIPTFNELTEHQTSGTADFVTYSYTSQNLVYSSAIPYSALALLQKAIINSGLYEKQSGVYIADINNSNLPFYIDPSFVDKLSNTTIIENFYNQKNLWEIMVEVGNYIHAIPELQFGSNDRFMITFNQLGRTDEQQKPSTRLSIFNSRSVEDYICAASSYITNMVQLGGYIEEWVAPKTTDEQLLISNNTVQILTSKPIIELLEIKVRRNSDGAVADMTNYIYEKNVYKTLSIDYRLVPNRGIALYYELGTNIIAGGDYQLPQANTNIYTDYAIKKIIYSAFNGYPVLPNPPVSNDWTNLKVNDYSFFVRYRTKDSVRQNHIRPDLRKYLLNTKWDRYPEHNQFNNQTDVVVDSIKFGNNMFGKLIKTGNNSYDIYEWNDSWENVKHKGELYRINEELYYVAKASHTIYSNFIVSKISYSKDYNELSNIIGIPSEPRFYEISEQSIIAREFEINDILLLTDKEEELSYKSNYVSNYDHLGDLILGEGTDFAKYAVTVFKGDNDTGTYDQTVGQSNLYIEIINPINAYSSENTLTYEYDMIDNYSAGDKVITTKQAVEKKGSYNSLWAVKYTDIYGRAALMDFYILGDIGTPTPAETMAFPESPINTKKQTYITTLETTTTPTDAELTALVQEIKAREPQENDVICIILTQHFEEIGTVVSYYLAQFENGAWLQMQTESDQTEKMKRAFIGGYDILATNVLEYDTNFNRRGIGLLKDCREQISVNYNLRMATMSDTFVLSPYVYLPKKSNVKLVLLAEEVNKLSTGYIDNAIIITPIDKQGNTMDKYFDFEIQKPTTPNSWDTTKNVVTKFGINLASVLENVADEHFVETEGYPRIKAIAILCDVSLDAGIDTENPTIPNKTQFIVARNIPEYWDRTKALASWWWGAPNKSLVFKNKQ